MNVVTLSVASREEVTHRALSAFEGREEGAHISFASAELLWRTLTSKCWELLKAMTGQGSMTIREAARRVGRDVKAVHGDVATCMPFWTPASSTALKTAGSFFRTKQSMSTSC